MAAPKHFHGARAKCYIYDATTGLTRLVGIWNHFSYRVSYDVQASYILGRYSPAALTTTGVEPVSIDAGGWRIVDHGPFVEGRVTNLKDLLTQEYLVLKLYDRQTKEFVATIHGCLPTGYASGADSKALATMTLSYLGLLMDDESTQNDEASDAAQLP